MVLLAFFDSQDDLRESDTERQDYANYYLTNLRFTYKDSDREDKSVSKFKYNPQYLSNNDVAEMEGALPQPLHPPDLCVATLGYRRFHESPWPS